MMINGRPHGPMKATTTCQLHMRSSKDGDTIVIEPFRAKAFPVLRDPGGGSTSFDRIIQAGGFISANTGSAPEANSMLVPKPVSDEAMNAAACHRLRRLRGVLPQRGGDALHRGEDRATWASSPRASRSASSGPLKMVETMDGEKFGHCHQRGRMHRGLPEEDPDRGDRADESRLPAVDGPRPGGEITGGGGP